MSLLTNLVAYYKLDDLTDSSGNGHVLTNTGGVTFGAGLIGNSSNSGINNTTKMLSVTTDFGLTYASPFSVSCWVNFNTVLAGTNTSQFIWGMMFGTNPGTYHEVYQYGSTPPALATGNGGLHLQPYPTLTTGVWYHVVNTVDQVNGISYIYFNGVNNGWNWGVFTGNYSTYTGAFGLHGPGWTLAALSNTMIDEVGVWSRVLTPTEITQLYNAGAGLQYPFGITPSANTNKGFFAFFK